MSSLFEDRDGDRRVLEGNVGGILKTLERRKPRRNLLARSRAPMRRASPVTSDRLPSAVSVCEKASFRREEHAVIVHDVIAIAIRTAAGSSADPTSSMTRITDAARLNR